MIIKTDKREYQASLFEDNNSPMSPRVLVELRVKKAGIFGESWKHLCFGESVPYALLANKNKMGIELLFRDAVSGYELHEDRSNNVDEMLREYE